MSNEADDALFSSVAWDNDNAPKLSSGSERDGAGERGGRSGVDDDAGPSASTSSAPSRPFPAQRALSVLELRPDGFIQGR